MYISSLGRPVHQQRSRAQLTLGSQVGGGSLSFDLLTLTGVIVLMKASLHGGCVGMYSLPKPYTLSDYLPIEGVSAWREC